MKLRLDNLLVKRGLVTTRSQAENYIRLGKVLVEGKVYKKPGSFVDYYSKIKLSQSIQYVSRAGMKLESVADILRINFVDKIVLDVGSSTGGFTDFSLKNGASKVIAVDVGTDQLHPKLRRDPRVHLFEKTDIRNFKTDSRIDIVLIDVSFISIREILPSIIKLVSKETRIIAMVKPQFEAGKNSTTNGVVKNNSLRRSILHDFEAWCRTNNLYIEDKKDSQVKGVKGNQERFYSIRYV